MLPGLQISPFRFLSLDVTNEDEDEFEDEVEDFPSSNVHSSIEIGDKAEAEVEVRKIPPPFLASDFTKVPTLLIPPLLISRLLSSAPCRVGLVGFRHLLLERGTSAPPIPHLSSERQQDFYRSALSPLPFLSSSPYLATKVG